MTLEELNAILSSDFPNRQEVIGPGFSSAKMLSNMLERKFEEGMTWENVGTFWKVELIDKNGPVNFKNIKPVKV